MEGRWPQTLQRLYATPYGAPCPSTASRLDASTFPRSLGPHGLRLAQYAYTSVVNEVKMELARGIAHVSFAGGGIFLPARDPYDRQTLIEHVNRRVHAKGCVQVLIDSHRWIVQSNSPPLASACAVCGQTADTACYSSGGHSAPYCVCCALGGATCTEPAGHEEWRQVG